MFIALAIFMYAAWSSMFSLGKLALANGPPIFLTGFRMFFAGVILIAWLGIKDRKALKIGKKQIVPLLALAVFSIYLTNIFEFSGKKSSAISLQTPKYSFPVYIGSNCRPFFCFVRLMNWINSSVTLP